MPVELNCMLPSQVGEFEFPYQFHHASLGMELNLLAIFHFLQDVPLWGFYFDVLVEDHHQFLQSSEHT